VTIFTPGEIELLARMEHTRWMAERILAGWTHAPDPKDITRKTSPYLVPWEELAPEIQQYDCDFVVLIPTLLAADHKKICRQKSPCND
jgi:hypothetical protein